MVSNPCVGSSETRSLSPLSGMETVIRLATVAAQTNVRLSQQNSPNKSRAELNRVAIHPTKARDFQAESQARPVYVCGCRREAGVFLMVVMETRRHHYAIPEHPA